MGLFDRLIERGDAVRELKDKYSNYSDYDLKTIVRREGSANKLSREVHAAFMVLQDRGYSPDEIVNG
ncbi:hypothetical protein [Asaccharospora irregularis]|uniref:Uncharacterized protein n=1 Tax=Asaccharospora irregularis DSM 2635 TaxID=1121321 RepID=A0A1M5TF83_9FIRM|nr:hypothetical protein [Asaccharospora irregularis]SHH49321.1 hypothetical protein SAMN04488530_1592 [Asaccharospora irregularis DSM 2635]